MSPVIHSVFTGGPKVLCDEKGEWVSSIARARVQVPVRLGADGLEGDKVAQHYHGGPDAALCVHLVQHYDFWRNQYGIHFLPGYLGENLVLDGIGEEDICVGDVVRIGSALVPVSGPRVPCANQARRARRADWVKLTIQENRTGFYLRVLEQGVLEEGDAWILEERVNQGGSIVAINRCVYLAFNPECGEAIAQMAGLAEWWKEQLREKVRQLNKHWSDETTG